MKIDDLKPPLAELFKLGAPPRGEEWPDYLSFGLGPEHVPDLIRLAVDKELNLTPRDTSELWVPVHAWRALGQLGAAEAAQPLTQLLPLFEENLDERVGAELPRVFGLLGAPAAGPLSEYLSDGSHPQGARIAAAQGLSMIAARHPEAYDNCVSLLAAQLRKFQENSETLNGCLITDLVSLEAVEHAPLMEQAFAAGRVDLYEGGDWEDTQIELGLKRERTTPREYADIFGRIKPKPAWKPPVDQTLAGLPRKERRRIERVRAKAERKQRKPGAASTGRPVYQLKVVLERSEPPIWRRVLVPADIKLSGLHRVLQILMGWTDDHRHQFTAFSKPSSGADEGQDVLPADESRFRLVDVAPTPGSELLYEYDFGDSWEHRITVEKSGMQGRETPSHPVCLAGERACPPEDCGGIMRYTYMVKALRDPAYSRRDELVDRLGQGFDPETFSVERVNAWLKSIEP
ncbi:plasmid pRiA4b ORF-3 family protein [candidate division WOR-3 bacterium]|nr:plasmid pRiA4b ORF-3 family protein [candidate division WOR-3 bacterium]